MIRKYVDNLDNVRQRICARIRVTNKNKYFKHLNLFKKDKNERGLNQTFLITTCIY